MKMSSLPLRLWKIEQNVPEEDFTLPRDLSAVNAVLHSCTGLMSNTKEELLEAHQPTQSRLLRTSEEKICSQFVLCHCFLVFMSNQLPQLTFFHCLVKKWFELEKRWKW